MNERSRNLKAGAVGVFAIGLMFSLVGLFADWALLAVGLLFVAIGVGAWRYAKPKSDTKPAEHG